MYSGNGILCIAEKEEPTRVAAVQEEEQENGYDVCNVRVQPRVLQLLDSITKRLEKLENERNTASYPREKQQRRKKNRKRRNWCVIGVERRGILPEVVPCEERNRETDCPQRRGPCERGHQKGPILLLLILLLIPQNLTSSQH